MPKEDIDLPDLSKLSGTIPSNAFHALVEVKQMSNQAMSPPDVNLPDWSTLSGAVLSRASDALEEVKQLSNQTMSKKDIHLPNINWSKVSRDILTNASDALTETKKLVHEMSMYRHWSSDIQQYQEKLRRLIEMTSNLLGVHQIKVWGTILSSASKLWDKTLRGASKLIPSSTSDSNLRTTISCVSHVLTGVNIWSIRHPYITAAVLLRISENPDILLAPLQLTGKPAPYTPTESTVPLKSDYYKPPVTNEYENVDARNAESMAVLGVSWLTGLGAVFVLGRTWGWWD